MNLPPNLHKKQTVWRYRGVENPELSSELLQAAENSALLARLLYNRGITTPEKVREFLDLKSYQPTSGLELPDIESGLERIIKALDNDEPILIYGDFDVDGQTGTAILYATLQHLNARVSYYIPDRATEGHGLNTTALCRLVSSRKLRLVITTDTGITDFNEVSLLKGLGVDTIVTDHHDLPENLPPAVANINPKILEDSEHPLYSMCGAGVAFKFCEELLMLRGDFDFAETLLDIAAIGTVVDMMPLVKENRWLVWRGCQRLNQVKRPGIKALLEQAGTPPEKPITSETLGFTIGPRLNALGRLERADDGVELLTTNDPERARIIAAHLEALNRRRQDMCEQTLIEAERYLSSHGGLNNHRVIILASPDWHPGIIGLVATRLKEKYGVPVFMMLVDKEKGEVRCSARSIEGFHLHQQMDKLSDYFLHFGGHAGAGGFALKLERLEAFKAALYKLAEQEITDEQMCPILDVDARLNWGQLTPGLIEMVESLQPVGQANPSPRFVLENVAITAQRALGDSGKHLKLILDEYDDSPNKKKQVPRPIEGLIWNYNREEKLDQTSPVSFVVVPELNTFRNQSKVQLIIQDYLLSGNAAKKSERKGAESTSVKPSDSAARLSPSNSSAITWIDHRNREGVDTFIGQLMLPLQEGRSIALYNEGRPPDIAFLDPSILCTRETLATTDELILWDLPPDPVSFQKLMTIAQPRTLHLVGGKYQQVPVFTPGRDFLKVIYQMLRKTQETPDSRLLDVTSFSKTLATTPDVIISGLILLNRMGLVSLRLPEGKEKTQGPLVEVTLNPPNGKKQDVHDYLEFIAFEKSLNVVGAFRDFLLTTPLDTIKHALEHLFGEALTTPLPIPKDLSQALLPRPEKAVASPLA